MNNSDVIINSHFFEFKYLKLVIDKNIFVFNYLCIVMRRDVIMRRYINKYVFIVFILSFR